MKSNWIILVVFSLVLAFFILAGGFSSSMPEQMASHWNAVGEADGTASKFWGLFLMPLIALGTSALLLAIPKIDPLKANIQKFKGYYYGFTVAFLVYLLYIYLLTLLWNLGLRFNVSLAIMPSVGVLMFVVGLLISKAKRNFFIGIRTPWTLSSDEVWDRTHRLGGRLFKIAGVVVLLLSFLPSAAEYVMPGLLLGITVWLFIYSYLVYRRLEQSAQSRVGR